MRTIEDIKGAIAELPSEQFGNFRAWFEEFEAKRFDARIKRDAKSDKLGRQADEALAEFRAGRCREL